MKSNDIDIGKIIQKKIKEDGHSITWVARKMNCDRTNIYKIFQNSHINTLQLLRISKVLNYDFFIHFSEYFAENKKSVEFFATEM